MLITSKREVGGKGGEGNGGGREGGERGKRKEGEGREKEWREEETRLLSQTTLSTDPIAGKRGWKDDGKMCPLFSKFLDPIRYDRESLT